jgi:tRNA-dihydrouridine synthase B
MNAMISTVDTRPQLAAKRDSVRALLERADVLLSPMAGVSDLVFRAICKEHGADVTYCEFVSAEGVLHGNRATRDLMELSPDEHPVGIQLFGSNPRSLAEAAREAEALGPDLIDLNFGCPVKKVVKRNGGSALLCNVPLMEEIVRAVVAATALPVTAKIRLGWSRDSMNYLEVTRMLEEAGVCAITVHGRTRDQRFTGRASWGPIGEIKRLAHVPVVGNGDVWNAADYLRLRRETGCDAVMIARGSIGNPWIFEEIKTVLAGVPYRAPDLNRVMDTIVDHLDREIALKGPRIGLNRMKRHFGGYLKGQPGAAQLRKELCGATTRETVGAALEEYRRAHGGRWAA